MLSVHLVTLWYLLAGDIYAVSASSDSMVSVCAGDIYAIGPSSDSTVVVSVVEPRPYRIVNAWKIHNITVIAFVLR